MLPDPLHPALVHFPIVFVVLLPLAVAAALWAIRRGTAPRRAWAIPVLLAAALVGSSWVAVRTGEGEEERVEDAVARRPLHQHEEAGERFMVLSGVLLLVAASGFAPGVVGRAGRGLTLAGAAALVIAGYQVGHSGGKLAYQHGAAGAYTTAQQGVPAGETGGDRHERDDGDGH